MDLELAEKNQTSDICNLLNLAYRGKVGWTTESQLVDGERANIQDIDRSISLNNSTFLVHYNMGKLLACICLEQSGNETYIGSFAVNPTIQNKGLGKAVLKAAEDYSIDQFNSNKFVMVVLSERTELISFYERQGYKKDGVKTKYPVHLGIGIPKHSNVTIEKLSKYV